jgi:hypothetical protein
MPKLKFGKKAIFGMTLEEFIPVLIAIVIIFVLGYAGSKLFAAVVPNQQDQATLNNFFLLTGKTDELLKNQRLTGFMEFPYSISQGNILVAFDYDSDRILYLKNLVKSGGQYDVGNAFRPVDCGNKACICVYKLPLLSPGKLSMPAEKERDKGIVKCRQFGGKIKFASIPSPQIDKILTTSFEGITLNGYKKLEQKSEIRAQGTPPTEEKTLPAWDKGYASLLWAAYTNSAPTIHLDKYEENNITYIFISPVGELPVVYGRKEILKDYLNLKAETAYFDYLTTYVDYDLTESILYYDAILEESAFKPLDKNERMTINSRLGHSFFMKGDWAQSVLNYETWFGLNDFKNMPPENIGLAASTLAEFCFAKFSAKLSYEEQCEFAINFAADSYKMPDLLANDKILIKSALQTYLCGESAKAIGLSLEGCKKQEVIAMLASA